jgi:dipeptidyl aminopeptidase/acylaminoacyl peptidase
MTRIRSAIPWLALLPAALALVAVAGLARPSDRRAAAQVPGEIVFTDVGAASEVELFTIQPDGQGRRQRSDTAGVVEAAPSWAPDGRRIAFTARVAANRWALQNLDLDSGAVTGVTQGPLDYDPAWSPLGDVIAFAGHFDLGGTVESSTLSIVPPDGLGTRPLLLLEDRSRFIRYPTWAPDAGRIAFSVQPGAADAEIYVVGADGSDPHRLLAHPGWDDVDPAWSPDGRQIAFASGPFAGSTSATRHAIWLLDLATGVIGTIVSDPTRDLRRPAWSPDGTQIVFDARTGSDASSRWDLHIVPSTGGALGPPLTGGREPDWGAVAGTRPTATPTPDQPTAEPTAQPTATGPTPTGPTPTRGPTNTPPPVPTFPSFPTLVPFPTFPPPEPTQPGPAPTYPPPTATPTRTPTASATPTITTTPGITPSRTPGGPGSAYLPITYLLWPEPTPTVEVTPTPEPPTPEVTPTPELTPTPDTSPTALP